MKRINGFEGVNHYNYCKICGDQIFSKVAVLCKKCGRESAMRKLNVPGAKRKQQQRFLTRKNQKRR